MTGRRLLLRLFVCQLCTVVLWGLAPSDLDSVTKQLGYQPTNFVKVSARTKDGSPIAIQTYPLDGGAQRRQSKARRSVENETEWLGTPFPTLFWLTHPDISRCIGELERKGYVKKIEEELQQSEEMSTKLTLAHHDYAHRRWDSLSDEDRQKLIDRSLESPTVQRMRNMLESSGIAGSNLALERPTIKCLHTHYAHFRSVDSGAGVNPVGARVHEFLQQGYPNLIL